jgi:hypothetical protein
MAQETKPNPRLGLVAKWTNGIPSQMVQLLLDIVAFLSFLLNLPLPPE